MILLLDMDGPLADFDRHFYQRCLELGYEFDVPGLEHQRHRFFTEHMVDKVHKREARKMVDSAGWFEGLPVTPGAKEGVRSLLDAGHDVWVCTKPLEVNPTCRDAKGAWLREFFPELERKLIIAPDKSLVRGDILLDDAPHIASIPEAVWRPVVFNAPYNGEGSEWERFQHWTWGDPIEELTGRPLTFADALDVMKGYQDDMLETMGVHPVSRGVHPVSRGVHPVSRGVHPVSRGVHPVSRGIPEGHHWGDRDTFDYSTIAEGRDEGAALEAEARRRHPAGKGLVGLSAILEDDIDLEGWTGPTEAQRKAFGLPVVEDDRVPPGHVYLLPGVGYRRRPIGLSGLAGAGKDTAAAALEEHDYIVGKFARPLYEAVYLLDPWLPITPLTGGGWHEGGRLKMLVDMKGWEWVKRTFPEARRLLQVMGTEVGRELIGEDTWVNAADLWYDQQDAPVVWTDMRFPNEVAWLRSRGGLWVHIERPGHEPEGQGHKSEGAIDPVEADYTLKNIGTVEELRNRLLMIVESER